MARWSRSFAIETTLFSKTSNGGYSLLIVAILSVGLMIADTRYKTWLEPVRYYGNLGLTPIYTVMSWPGRFGDWAAESAKPDSQLREENEFLRSQLLVLSGRVQKFSELAAENARLRGLIDSTLVVDGRVLIAEIIGVDPDPFRHIIMLNKGADTGIYVGQPLLDAKGLLGQVIEVGPSTSRAMLITDRQHAVPVRVNRNGIRAILAGTGEFDQLQLLYVPESADIKVGDMLVSSGLGQRFPAGYPVGTVTEVKHTGGAEFAQITAKPMAEVDRSRHVLLLFNRPLSQEQPRAVPANGGTHATAQ